MPEEAADLLVSGRKKLQEGFILDLLSLHCGMLSGDQVWI